jgi:CRISPR-associated protein Cas5d
MTNNLVTVRVWGDFACFTRPEMKVERVSYPVMTPSAARGILEAIFWEPQMYYLIDAIRVVKRGYWFSFRRNEVISVISLDSAKTWMKAPDKVTPIQAGGGAPDGTQRNMLALEDVEYLITAEVRLTELGKRNNHLSKYLEEIRRRTQSGKCYHRPALGVREFAADFEWEEDAQSALERRATELDGDWRDNEEELGLMLYDVFDVYERAEGFRWLSPAETVVLQEQRKAESKKLSAAARRGATKTVQSPYEGKPIKPEATFFHASVRESKLDCHPERVRFARQANGVGQ